MNSYLLGHLWKINQANGKFGLVLHLYLLIWYQYQYVLSILDLFHHFYPMRRNVSRSLKDCWVEMVAHSNPLNCLFRTRMYWWGKSDLRLNKDEHPLEKISFDHQMQMTNEMMMMSKHFHWWVPVVGWHLQTMWQCVTGKWRISRTTYRLSSKVITD